MDIESKALKSRQLRKRRNLSPSHYLEKIWEKLKPIKSKHSLKTEKQLLVYGELWEKYAQATPCKVVSLLIINL